MRKENNISTISKWDKLIRHKQIKTQSNSQTTLVTTTKTELMDTAGQQKHADLADIYKEPLGGDP